MPIYINNKPVDWHDEVAHHKQWMHVSIAILATTIVVGGCLFYTYKKELGKIKNVYYLQLLENNSLKQKVIEKGKELEQCKKQAVK
jgi:hypothetical protein